VIGHNISKGHDVIVYFCPDRNMTIVSNRKHKREFSFIHEYKMS